MSRDERRKEILKMLSESQRELSGRYLASKFGVTRQIIVQDIAVLKSKGYKITSTTRGYLLNEKERKGVIKVIAVQHSEKRIKEELECIVENGGEVLNVMIEHPLYGELSGNIGVKTLDDVEKFISAFKTSNATPLLSLSNGVHLHTIAAEDENTMRKILKSLEERHFILK
jgi:transcriptional regulator of NAD metabolism